MGRLLKEKDINLLINSRIINDHPELQSFIKETPTWDDRKLEELDKDWIYVNSLDKNLGFFVGLRHH